MNQRPQLSDLIQFLSTPTSYAKYEGEVSVIQTHISVVAITERFVYKLKKDVKFDFLDFSTLEKRLFYCQEEVRLNQRLSTDLYVGILPVYYDGQTLSFESKGEAVDYVVQMRRLSEEGLLINQIKSPGFQLSQLDSLTKLLLEFYHNAASSPEIAAFGSAASIRNTMLEITADFDEYTGHTLTPAAGQWIKTYLFDFINSHLQLFANRIKAGKIIEGHGDLRSEHIHSENDIVTIYDCIEFSQRLRCLDWLNDLAFLLMDLDYRHCHRLAVYIQTKLLGILENEDFTSLLNFYKTYRACVRGKVDTLKFKEPEISTAVRDESCRKAARYFQLAFRYTILGAHPTVLVCMGGGATGKSTLAAALANELGLPVLSSDVIRKERAGIDLFKRLPDVERSKLYDEKTTENVYREIEKRALHEVDQSGAVMLDATYRNKEYLVHLQEVCIKNSIRLSVIQTVASREIIQDRLKKRESEPSVSDLRYSDYVPERFEIGYAIEDVIENGIKAETNRDMQEVITEVILPRLFQKAH